MTHDFGSEADRDRDKTAGWRMNSFMFILSFSFSLSFAAGPLIAGPRLIINLSAVAHKLNGRQRLTLGVKRS